MQEDKLISLLTAGFVISLVGGFLVPLVWSIFGAPVKLVMALINPYLPLVGFVIMLAIAFGACANVKKKETNEKQQKR